MTRLTWRRVAVGAALAGVGFAVWVGYAPETLPASIRRGLVPDVDSRIALAMAGAVAGVIGLLYSWLTEPDATAPLSERAATKPARTVTVAGADLSVQYERLVENGPPADPERDPIRRRLRDVVVESVERERNDATAYIDRGAWTDDRYAAAFLTTAPTVDYPWYHRLYAWLYPGRAYERRVHRALAAVERTCADRLSGYEPPPSSPDGRLRALRAVLEGSS